MYGNAQTASMEQDCDSWKIDTGQIGQASEKRRALFWSERACRQPRAIVEKSRHHARPVITHETRKGDLRVACKGEDSTELKPEKK